MRILFVDEFFPPARCGGAEIAAKEIAAGIGRNHEVVVFTPSYGQSVGSHDAENFTIFRYRNRFNPDESIIQQKLLFFIEMMKSLDKFVRVFKPEILHAQNALSVPPVAKVAGKHRIVGVAHVRDHRFECFTSRVACLSHHDATPFEFARCVENPLHVLSFPYAKLITHTVRRAIEKCGKAFTVSTYLRDELLRSTTTEVRVSYDGVDLQNVDRIQAAGEIGRCHFDPQKRIIYAGGSRKSKGVLELLKGFLDVSKKMKDASLWIAGNGPDRKDVQRFVKANGLGDNVAFFGPLSHDAMISAIKASRVVAVPSLMPEAGSRIVMEALACGKPVLASNRGANPEMVGAAGITFAPTAHNIARAILDLLDDQDRLEKLSALAKERSSRFSLSATCSQITQAYEEWLR